METPAVCGLLSPSGDNPAAPPQGPLSAGIEFWSFLDGYLSAPDPGMPESKPQPEPAGKRRPDPMAAPPIALPVAWPAPIETPILKITIEPTADGRAVPAAAPDPPCEPACAVPQAASRPLPAPPSAPAPRPETLDAFMGAPDRPAVDPAAPVAAGHELAFGARLTAPDPAAAPVSSVPPAMPLENQPAPEGKIQTIPPASLPPEQPLARQPRPARRPADATPEEPSETRPPAARISAGGRPARTPDDDGDAAPAPRKAETAAGQAAGLAAEPSAGHPVSTLTAEAPAVAANREPLRAPEVRMAAAARVPEIEEAPAEPVSRDIALRWSEGPGRVDIRMAEHAGEIRVTVHTPHHDLANALRADLPDLVRKLRQDGYQMETWQGGDHRETGSDPGTSQHHPRDGGGQDRQPPHPRKDPSAWDGAWKATLGPSGENDL